MQSTTLWMSKVPPLGYLVWTWYWQSRVVVETEGPPIKLRLLNGRSFWVEEVPPAWVFSGWRCQLHPATYACESLFDVPYLDWSETDGLFTLTVPGEPLIQTTPPPALDLQMTYLLRQGYRVEEVPGREILIHTPGGAFRQVTGNECSCTRPSCIHRMLARYGLQHRQLLSQLGLFTVSQGQVP